MLINATRYETDQQTNKQSAAGRVKNSQIPSVLLGEQKLSTQTQTPHRMSRLYMPPSASKTLENVVRWIQFTKLNE